MNEISLINSLFNDVFDTSAMCYTKAAAPRVDIEEDDKSYTLEMELPGRTEKDVEIELNQNNLKISSAKTLEKEEKKEEKKAGKYILKERRTSSFERSFILPKDVDTEKLSADFKNGILTIYMEKKTSESPRKIEIKAA